jgi:hypothetical protein
VGDQLDLSKIKQTMFLIRWCNLTWLSCMGESFILSYQAGGLEKVGQIFKKKKKNRVNLWRRLKNFIEAQWFYS